MLKVDPSNLKIFKNIFSKFPTTSIQYKSEMEIQPGELPNELRPPISTVSFPKHIRSLIHVYKCLRNVEEDYIVPNI